MLKWVVLCCVVVYAAGQEDAGCCTPNQWEGDVGVVTGFSGIFHKGLITEGIRLSYDFNNKKLAETVYIRVRNKTINVGLIFDFSKKKMYRFNPSSKRCKSRDLQASFKKFCIPDGARSLGNYYFGAGSNKLQISSYAFSSRKLKFGMTMTVTRPGCIPVGEEIVGSRRFVKFMTNVGFVNITPGIKSKSVFTPPSYCESDSKTPRYEDAHDEELDIFLVEYMHDKLME